MKISLVGEPSRTCMSFAAEMSAATKQDAAENPKKAKRSGRGRKYLGRGGAAQAAAVTRSFDFVFRSNTGLKQTRANADAA